MALRLLQIGLGIGLNRAIAARDMDGIELVGCVDFSEAALKKAGKKLDSNGIQSAKDIEYGKNWTDWIHRPDIDAVVVSLPTPMHFDVVRAFLHEGKDVLCEKPLATNANDAEFLANLAREEGQELKVGFNYPYRAPMLLAHGIIRAGIIGTVSRADFAVGHGQFIEDREERSIEFLKDGPLNDLGIHAVDLARLVFSEEFVFAYGSEQWDQTICRDIPDKAKAETEWATFVTSSGRECKVVSSFAQHCPFLRLRCDVQGSKGSVCFTWSPNNVELMVRHEANTDPDEQRSEHELRIGEVIDSSRTLQRIDIEVEKSRVFRRDEPPLAYTRMFFSFGRHDTSLADELCAFRDKLQSRPTEALDKYLYRTANDGVVAQRLIESARMSAENEGAAVDVEKLVVCESAPTRSKIPVKSGGAQ